MQTNTAKSDKILAEETCRYRLLLHWITRRLMEMIPAETIREQGGWRQNPTEDQQLRKGRGRRASKRGSEEAAKERGEMKD